jgi:hypothetical protein
LAKVGIRRVARETHLCFEKRLAIMTIRKTATKKSAAKKGGAKSASRKPQTGSGENYTKPELRERIKKQVLAGDKGGRRGQWSARKAQLVTHDYEAQGGGYKKPRSAAQRSLKSWGDERWHTASGQKAVQGEKTHRYLPDEAWKKLSPEECKATDRKKVAASRRGRQFVANTAAAAKARKRATRQTSQRVRSGSRAS